MYSGHAWIFLLYLISCRDDDFAAARADESVDVFLQFVRDV
jgi:hypothetical protein